MTLNGIMALILRYFTEFGVAIVVVSVVRRMNEVTLRRARLILVWVTRSLGGCIPSRYLTSQLGQLSLASLWSC